MITIKKGNSNLVQEPLLKPFGFKGQEISELWQIIALLESDSGHFGFGLGVQSTLWSDASVFMNYGNIESNNIMFNMTRYALELAQGLSFDTPIKLLDKLLTPVHEYGKEITGNKALRKTFALNALVPVDNAAWMLYCKTHGIDKFDSMIPKDIKSALSYKHDKLASIPLLSYGVSGEVISNMVDEGYFFFKIKIGSDPEKDGDQEKMLAWDKNRLSEIHEILKDKEISYTENKRVPYYLDANGRYESKELLLRFLEHADKIGALDRIVLLEEPFAEDYKAYVGDIPVCIAADESAHSDEDVIERIELGYGAIALKPIAKTMSMSLKIAKIAHEKNIPCFCADLTVNPLMVDWNKNVAARLAPLPGMHIGVLESNGHQNYRNWEEMKSYHPYSNASWMETQGGLFNLQSDFYDLSGGIYQNSKYYLSLVR